MGNHKEAGERGMARVEAMPVNTLPVSVVSAVRPGRICRAIHWLSVALIVTVLYVGSAANFFFCVKCIPSATSRLNEVSIDTAVKSAFWEIKGGRREGWNGREGESLREVLHFNGRNVVLSGCIGMRAEGWKERAKKRGKGRGSKGRQTFLLLQKPVNGCRSVGAGLPGPVTVVMSSTRC